MKLWFIIILIALCMLAMFFCGYDKGCRAIENDRYFNYRVSVNDQISELKVLLEEKCLIKEFIGK